jgi:hypothetical protein
MNEELKREVALQINYLGDSEMALGYSRAETKDVPSIVAEIQKHRGQFEQHHTASIGSASFASQETWRKIAADAEREARNILLGNSSLLSEVSDLEKLNADFREFYRAILEGALVDRMALVFQAGVMVAIPM